MMILAAPSGFNCSCVLAVLALGLVAVGGAETVEPNKRMLDDPLEFTGVESSPAEVGEIRIGLLAPDGPEHPVGRAMTRGVTLALDAANAEGGMEGVPLHLVRRWVEDPWKGGAVVVSDMAFADGVVAIIGGPDGTSTHIAQMVATKAHLPLIAPVSTDPSLTHTRVPWIFRLPPDDATQARLLVERIIIRGDHHRPAILSSTDHDGRTAATEISRALEAAGRVPLAHLELPREGVDGAEIARRLGTFRPDVIVMRLPRTALVEVLTGLRRAGIRIPVCLPWIPGLDPSAFPLPYDGRVTMILPFERPAHCGPHLRFVRAFIRRWGEHPPPEAAYGYDAARLIVEGLRKAGRSRTGLRRALADLSAECVGASGPIRWDTGGGNAAAAPVIP